MGVAYLGCSMSATATARSAAQSFREDVAAEREKLTRLSLEAYDRGFERVTGTDPTTSDSWLATTVRAQLGVFMSLIMGAIALVVVSIVLFFGMDIAGSFAAGIDNDGTYADAANATETATGNAFNLFGTSVLVIPAAAVLAVLIGGLVGAVAYAGVGNIPGLNGGGMRRRR